ncbi:MAG: hypothetical protein FWD35_04815 [Oscillospiraceae bacterium]|nr:hypothetical protein [Oscillospiraceae bacterium]
MRAKDLAQKYEELKNKTSRVSSLQITHKEELCEVIAEGCRRVHSCDSVMVVFENAAGRRVAITGSGLQLRNWGTDGVVVSGSVQAVEFAQATENTTRGGKQ